MSIPINSLLRPPAPADVFADLLAEMSRRGMSQPSPKWGGDVDGREVAVTPYANAEEADEANRR